MHPIVNRIRIARPAEQVFDFATTPANWAKWHPATLAVSGAINHSARPGERVDEEIRVAGHRNRAHWIVCERVAPLRWVIEGYAVSGGRARITYALSGNANATEFVRELTYRMPNVLYRLMDWLFMRRLIAAESARALMNLKAVLEADRSSSPCRASRGLSPLK